MAKKKLSAADRAWLKNQEQMSGRAPVPPGVLPGQIDMLDGSIAGSTERVCGDEGYECEECASVEGIEHEEFDMIPDHCPRCKRTMLIASGWALLKPEESRKIQCGNCGVTIVVPQGAYYTLGIAIKAHFDRLNFVPPKQPKKSRGAG